MILELCIHQENPLEDLLKQTAGPPLFRASDEADLGWSLGICTSNEFPGDADAAGLGDTL